MSVVAWDGTTLAADTMMIVEGQRYNTSKMYRWSDRRVLGYVGPADMCAEWLRWMTGMWGEPSQFPRQLEKDDCFVRAIDIIMLDHNADPDKPADWHPVVAVTERTCSPIFPHNKTFAMGSGAQAAQAAMLLGADASTAVRIACAVNSDCGLPIEAITFNKQKGAFEYTEQPWGSNPYGGKTAQLRRDPDEWRDER